MRFLVVLDVRSPIGAIYAAGNNDGFVRNGHPVLDCVEVDTDQPHYIFVKRDLSKSGKKFQSLHIPHSSVVAIHCYAVKDSKPMGFVPPAARDDDVRAR